MTARRFRRGEPLNLAELVAEIDAGRYVIIDYGGNRDPKPQHPRFLEHQNLATLRIFAAAGRAFKAVERREPAALLPPGGGRA